ncbi:hypothetical protein BT63DRAFT_134673 [Microthyrium microscopicum]|uniref:Uncharacterized protein n=1 Tax=Microthyrium microscopicum TaxID=703497 RepID=A0A6A6UMI9_9PEZI|nr:hypothetical protein BT63DRAFT_134673 [Microthyrium microscopicum]
MGLLGSGVQTSYPPNSFFAGGWCGIVPFLGSLDSCGLELVQHDFLETIEALMEAVEGVEDLVVGLDGVVRGIIIVACYLPPLSISSTTNGTSAPHHTITRNHTQWTKTRNPKLLHHPPVRKATLSQQQWQHLVSSTKSWVLSLLLTETNLIEPPIAFDGYHRVLWIPLNAMEI